MKSFRYILVVSMLLSVALTASAQVDRRDVRAGNRKFRKDNWKEADISYRKALVKDSTSVAANYNLANTLYRQENYEEAEKLMKKIGDNASASANAADYWYNTGDIAIAKKDWQGAVNAFKEALLKNPSDMDAKENYIYAKKMLENQQKNGGGNGDGQDNQDQNNQNQDQNNQNQDQNKNGQDQNKDQNNDQNNDGQNKDQDQNQNQNNGQGNGNQQPLQGQEGKISPQQAQQMLRAIQAKEKETQDKVNKEKADALKSRQKEKNW